MNIKEKSEKTFIIKSEIPEPKLLPGDIMDDQDISGQVPGSRILSNMEEDGWDVDPGPGPLDNIIEN